MRPSGLIKAWDLTDSLTYTPNEGAGAARRGVCGAGGGARGQKVGDVGARGGDGGVLRLDEDAQEHGAAREGALLEEGVGEQRQPRQGGGGHHDQEGPERLVPRRGGRRF